MIRLLIKSSTDLQNVRSVKEAARMLMKIDQEVERIASPVDTLYKALSAGKKFSVTGPKSKPKTSVVKTVVKPPSKTELKSIADSWATVSKLKEYQNQLKTTVFHWSQRFKGKPGANELIAKMKATLANIDGQLIKSQTVMDRLGQKQAPRFLIEFGKMLERALDAELEFDGAKQRIMVVPDAKTAAPRFYLYLSLLKLKTKSGGFYPEYQIVLSAVPATGGFVYKITTLRSFELPGHFPDGRVVSSPTLNSSGIKETMLILKHELNIDEVFTDFRQSLPEMDMDLQVDGIAGAQVKDDYIFVRLKPHIKAPAAKEIAVKVADQIQGALGFTTRRTLTTKIITGGKGLVIRYAVQSLGREGADYRITKNKMDELQDQLDLSDADMGALRQALKMKGH